MTDEKKADKTYSRIRSAFNIMPGNLQATLQEWSTVLHNRFDQIDKEIDRLIQVKLENTKTRSYRNGDVLVFENGRWVPAQAVDWTPTWGASPGSWSPTTEDAFAVVLGGYCFGTLTSLNATSSGGPHNYLTATLPYNVFGSNTSDIPVIGACSIQYSSTTRVAGQVFGVRGSDEARFYIDNFSTIPNGSNQVRASLMYRIEE